MKEDVEKLMPHFAEWYVTLKGGKGDEGSIKGKIAAAFQVLGHLRQNFSLNFDDFLTEEKGQVKEISGPNLRKGLLEFGETRTFVKEGGRTTRGNPKAIKALFSVLDKMAIENWSVERRSELLFQFQSFLVERIRDFHNQKRIAVPYNANHSTWQLIHELLKVAKEVNKSGPVAQHLVGAKLQLRFPNLTISNESINAADAPTGRYGDFIIGDTVFHVTVAPLPGVYQKCKDNVDKGFRVYLLVSEDRRTAARQNVEDYCGGRVAVESIESFVSQNIEELSFFSPAQLMQELKKLFELYNRRVDEAETDKSLMIELPPQFS